MKRFSILAELKVGNIVEVAGDAIRIEIDSQVSELTRTYAGNVYPVAQCGSILKFHCGRKVLFAYVRVLRMRSEIAYEHGVPPPPPTEDARMIEATLFAEGVWADSTANLDLTRGISTYPLPGQSAYLTTLDELSALYGAGQSTVSSAHRILLGHYVGANDSECFADVDKLFGLHCAVLGSTGAGKSGTVAAVLHALLESAIADEENPASRRLRPRVVLIDPHGEYAKAFIGKSFVFRAYTNISSTEGEIKPATDSKSAQLKLPYWIMTGEEYRDLVVGKTQWEATNENNIVLKALRHSRLVARQLIEASRTDWKEKPSTGPHPADDRQLKNLSQSQKDTIASYDHDTPDPFLLTEFRTYIEHELRMRATRSNWEELSTTDFKSHAAILDKLTVLQRDPRLRFMMEDRTPDSADLPEILAQFVGELEPSTPEMPIDIRIVDISGLPNEIAGPLTAAIARLLFQYKVWQTRDERERDPVLLICEEAHRYVPDTGLAEYASAQKAIRRVAKEGRKYGLGLMLVSQRPADVEGTVLSQCNSWLVLRLTNAVDQEHVGRFLPDNLAGLVKMLPSLARQEALFVGDAAALPARIKIRTLSQDQLPSSDDVSFAAGWAKDPMPIDAIKEIVRRWRKEEPAGQSAVPVPSVVNENKPKAKRKE